MAVVCGTDFGQEAGIAAEIAAAVAARRGESVVLAHALELPTLAYVAGESIFVPPPVPATQDELKREVDRRLAAEAERIAARTGARCEPRLSIGTPEAVVLEAAQAAKAWLVVVGSQGLRAPVRWILGSTADRVVRSASVPVLVARHDASGLLDWAYGRRPLRLLVGIDLEESSRQVADFARELAPCEAHIAHAYELPAVGFDTVPATASTAIERELRKRVSAFASDGGPPLADRIHVPQGKPARALARLATDGRFDLLLVGTHGRRGLERMLIGSVAHGVLHRAPCPVVVVPV